jgi:predicted DNA binding protein
MATVAEFTVDADSFPLGRLFREFPDIDVELERVVPTRPGIVPYVWVSGVTADTVDEILAGAADIPALDDCRLIDTLDGGALLRLKWASSYQGILRALTEMDGILLAGRGTCDTWTFEIRVDDRGALSGFQSYCRDHGIELSVTSLRALSELRTGKGYDLTDRQRETLVLAYQRGYFRSPRQVTLDELAAELGVSGQAVGARLRRGLANLVASTLAENDT